MIVEKKRRMNWRKRRRARIENEQCTENNYRRHYRSILMYIFAKKRKKHKSLEEYRLRLLNLELIMCIIDIIIMIVIFIGIYFGA